jgi:hypothetical protein
VAERKKRKKKKKKEKKRKKKKEKKKTFAVLLNRFYMRETVQPFKVAITDEHVGTGHSYRARLLCYHAYRSVRSNTHFRGDVISVCRFFVMRIRLIIDVST